MENKSNLELRLRSSLRKQLSSVCRFLRFECVCINVCISDQVFQHTYMSFSVSSLKMLTLGRGEKEASPLSCDALDNTTVSCSPLRHYALGTYVRLQEMSILQHLKLKLESSRLRRKLRKQAQPPKSRILVTQSRNSSRWIWCRKRKQGGEGREAEYILSRCPPHFLKKYTSIIFVQETRKSSAHIFVRETEIEYSNSREHCFSRNLFSFPDP